MVNRRPDAMANPLATSRCRPACHPASLPACCPPHCPPHCPKMAAKLAFARLWILSGESVAILFAIWAACLMSLPIRPNMNS